MSEMRSMEQLFTPDQKKFIEYLIQEALIAYRPVEHRPTISPKHSGWSDPTTVDPILSALKHCREELYRFGTDAAAFASTYGKCQRAEERLKLSMGIVAKAIDANKNLRNYATKLEAERLDASIRASQPWTEDDQSAADDWRALTDDQRSNVCAVCLMAEAAFGEGAPEDGREHEAAMGRALRAIRVYGQHVMQDCPKCEAERADEGLEEEAVKLRDAYTAGADQRLKGWYALPDKARENWLRVARAARALRRGGDTALDEMTIAHDARGHTIARLEGERDALAAKLAEAQAERDELRNERNKALNELDKQVGVCNSLRAELDAERAGHAESVRNAEDLMAERNAVAAELEAERESHAETHDLAYEATRSAPPAVAVTDCEKAAREIGSETASYAHEMLAILRKHTRSVSVEEVAEAMYEARDRVAHGYYTWEELSENTKTTWRNKALAALRALGVREAHKNAPPPPAPAQAGWTEERDRDYLGRKVREAWIRWANTRPDPKPSWLVPYDALEEHDKEADRQIGESIYALAANPPPEKNATPFVVDREKVTSAISRHAGTSTAFTAKEASDAAISEYEGQRAEWEAGK